MTKRRFWAFVCALVLACNAWAAAVPARPAQTKLVVLVMIDQFRYDYLTRFMSQYTGGFKTLWSKGAVFTNARLEHFPTVTAVGHSTVMTGATPSLSGIVANEWFDRELGRSVTSVFDPKVSLLGASKGTGASPARLLVSTVGDEVKMSGKGQSKAIGISLKDRAAILPAGRMADAAYWFDAGNGNFISSTFYFPALPAWVSEFNTTRLVDKSAGAEWKSTTGEVLAALPKETGTKYYTAFEKTPYATDLLVSFAERAIESEKLGLDAAPDILTVSLSSTDLLGHDVGPDSKEIRELHLQTDRQLGQFFQYLEKRFPPSAVLVVFASDHGVAPLPEVQAARRMPGGRFIEADLRKTVEAALTAKFGEGKWIDYASSGSFWINRATLAAKKLAQPEAERAVARTLAALPHVSRVYTATQLLSGQLVLDAVGRRVANGFYAGRAADVITVLEPYYIFGAKGTSHGAPYSYDTHIPLILLGTGIKPGKYDRPVALNDIAPTLATLLEVDTPSGAAGQVLTEALQR